MIQMTLDAARFRASVEKAARAGPEGRKTALVMLAHRFGQEVLQRSPVYTGRFKAAEAQSLNAANVGPFPVQPITAPQNSKWAAGIAKTLAKQRAYWEKRVRELVASGQDFPTGKRGNKLKRATKEYRYATKRLQLAIQYQAEWYASKGTAAVMNRKNRGYTDLVRAYAKVYGGTGRMLESSGQTVVQLINREPHARVVEQKKAIHWAAQNAVGRDYLQKVGAAYVAKIAAASGMARSA